MSKTKQRCCRVCKNPMKGHSRNGCKKDESDYDSSDDEETTLLKSTPPHQPNYQKLVMKNLSIQTDIKKRKRNEVNVVNLSKNEKKRRKIQNFRSNFNLKIENFKQNSVKFINSAKELKAINKDEGFKICGDLKIFQNSTFPDFSFIEDTEKGVLECNKILEIKKKKFEIFEKKNSCSMPDCKTILVSTNTWYSICDCNFKICYGCAVKSITKNGYYECEKCKKICIV